MIRLKLTPQQKKMAISASIVAAVFAALVVFAYLPMHRSLAAAQKEYESIDSEIAKIKEIAGADKPFGEVITMLKEKLDGISAKFPPKEEGIIKALSERAGRMGIKIDELNPSKKQAVTQLGGKNVKITSCDIEEMNMSVRFRTDFKKLGEFLMSIKHDFPFYIRIVSIDINRISDEKPPLLGVELKLSAYLVCPT